MDWLLKLDGDILIFIQEHIRNGFLTPIFKFITTLGNAGILWIVLTLILLIPKKTRKMGIICAVSLLLSLICNNLIIKRLVARTRPYNVIDGLVPLVAKPHEYSFPSGHAASSFAAAAVIHRHSPKLYGVPVLVLAFLIALSRLYVGVHYPSDVLFGMISGYALSWLAEIIVKVVTNIVKNRKENVD
jgi:undecaprenyl-diphosphatase